MTTIDELAVLARPAGEGGLRAVALGEIGGGTGCVDVWTSDDGGLAWLRRANLWEPCDAPGCPQVVTLLPLARRETGGAPVTGAALDRPETEWETSEAIAVLGRGAVFRTTDGGATWAREPGPAGQVPFERPTFDSARSAVFGPDGHLYVGVVRQGPKRAWLVRSAEALVVSSPPQAPSLAASALAVSVRPNPSSGRVAVAVDLAASSSPVRVVALDGLGREVARLHDGPAATSLRLVLDTSPLAPGVYAVRATAGDQSATARLTVAR